MSISINKISGNELHCHYNGQTEAQGCYIELDCKNEIESVLDDMETVDEYKNISNDDENPVYLVRFQNGRCETVQYNAEGKMTWIRSPLHPDNLTDTAIGRAYCQISWETKTPGGPTTRRRSIGRADNYSAARCADVPEPYRSACKNSATTELYQIVQKKFRDANATYFENKKQREDIGTKIAELERQLDALKKTLPDAIEPEYFSMASNGHACCYYNLTGHYPHIEK